jgi:hypothetical protein
LAAAQLAAAPGARGQVTAADLNVFVGERFLGATDWGTTSRQGELGLLTNWQWRTWPVLVAVDFLGASRTAPVGSGPLPPGASLTALGVGPSTEEDAHTFELDLGARKIWKPTAAWRPFLGGGLALAYADIDYTGNSGPQASITSSGSGVGYWIDGGVFMFLGDAFNVGFDARFSSADVRLFGTSRDVGGLQVGLLAGYHFGE